MNLPTRTSGPTIRYTLIQASYWGCYSAIITYASVYLLDQGFSNAQIGSLIAVAGLLSALLQPFVSRVADGLRRMTLRQFSALLVSAQVLAGVLLFFLPGRLPQTLLYGVLLVLIQLVLPLCSALGMACLNNGLSLNFGVARGAGSISFGLFSALLGRLVLWFGTVSVPAAITALNVLFLVSVLLFRFKGTEAAPAPTEPAPAQPPRDRPFLLKYRRVVWLLLGVVLLLLSHNVLNTFAFQIVQPLGGDSGQMGTMLMIQALVELPVMFFFTWLVQRAGSRLWLRLSGIGFFLHALGTLLAPNMFVMYLIQIFEMNGYALFALASIYFVNETVAETERVQGQAWVSMAMTLGNVLASFLGGLLLDHASVIALLAFATATGAAGMFLFWGLLKKETSTMMPTAH